MMKTNLRGELTLYKDEEQQQFSLRDNELIDAVASHFKVGSTEVNKSTLKKPSIVDRMQVVIESVGTLRSDDGDGNGNAEKSNRFN